MTALRIIAMIFLALSSIALVIVVLLQPGKRAGMSGAIAGGAETIFGKGKASGLEELCRRITKWVAIAFFVLSLAVLVIDKFI